jgi:RNA 3'-terminal phosphate cyclase
VNLGSTSFEFNGSGTSVTTALVIDLDDPNRTFATDTVAVSRNYEDASDHFEGNIDNVAGRGIRGHAVAMFFMSLLPILAHAGDPEAATIDAFGSTETAGGPFVDAIGEGLYPLASLLTERTLSIKTLSRGLMGCGGGAAVAVSAPPTGCRPERAEELLEFGSQERATIVSRYYVFGGTAFRAIHARMCVAHAAAVSGIVERHVTADVISVPYRLDRVQELHLIHTGGLVRDVSICGEELGGGLLDVERTVCRLAPELDRSHIPSRFLVEQLLPLLSTLATPSTLMTDHVTPHLRSVAHVIETLTNRTVSFSERETYAKVSLQ